MADTISISDLGYKPTEWKNGDVITSEKLNKLENATGFFVIELERGSDNSPTGIKASYNDILHALSQGKLPVVIGIDPNTNKGVSLGFITDILAIPDSETGSYAYGCILIFLSHGNAKNLIAEDPDANLEIYTQSTQPIN